MKNDITVMKNVSKEFYEMFNTMEEGIVVFKDEIINFSNNAFREIINSFDDDEIGLDLIKYKLFKIYRENKSEGMRINVRRRETKSKFNISKELYSIQDILREDAEFLEDKIFEIMYVERRQRKRFKYV